jgi:hypothetical protein
MDSESRKAVRVLVGLGTVCLLGTLLLHGHYPFERLITALARPIMQAHQRQHLPAATPYATAAASDTPGYYARAEDHPPADWRREASAYLARLDSAALYRQVSVASNGEWADAVLAGLADFEASNNTDVQANLEAYKAWEALDAAKASGDTAAIRDAEIAVAAREADADDAEVRAYHAYVMLRGLLAAPPSSSFSPIAAAPE